MATVRTTSLQCKNNCGFYGNPSWDGYCSRCYREAYPVQTLSRPSNTTISNVSTQAFSKFEAKRKQIAWKGTNTLKNIFKFSRDEIRDRNTVIPEEAQQAGDEFNNFLDTLKAVVGGDVSKQVSKFLENLEAVGGSNINQYSLMIQNFYSHISKRISSNPLYSGMSPASKESLMNHIEHFLTTWIYCWAFASSITDDEAIDLKLQEKIRSLHWISPELLGSPVNPNNPEQAAHLEEATFALIQVNSLFASEDKLSQITRCCRSVFNALKVHYQSCNTQTVHATSTSLIEDTNSMENDQVDPLSNKPAEANADDFLPTLILVVLSANPPLLFSNLQFIARFANQNRLNSGEAAYFFTSLSCAVHFLKDLTHESLKMSEDEFYRCMRTGMCLSDRSVTLSEGEKLLADNAISLAELEDKTNEFKSYLDNTEKDMKDFYQTCYQTFRQVRMRWPLKIRVDDLDPRQLENPHVLLLGPYPKS